jgi:hypothetical protein
MKPNWHVNWVFLLLWTRFSCPAVDDSGFWEDLPRRANAWNKGEPIPSKLLEYRSSHREGMCFQDPRGTEFIFGCITNYELLKAITFMPKTDVRVFTNAVNNAVKLVGPLRFFSDLTNVIAQNPRSARLKRIKILKAQAAVRHIVVDSLFINYADMPPDSAMRVLTEMKAELEHGRSFEDVYMRFSTKFEYSFEEKRGDGTVNGTRTRIGNLGDFVLPANQNILFSYREDYMPKAHISKLFEAKPGAVLILYDKMDVSQYPARKDNGECLVLHRVREVYGQQRSP